MNHNLPPQVDNKPNRQFPVLSFAEYRSILDPIDGLMRTGLYNEHMYQDACADPATQYVQSGAGSYPVAAPNSVTEEFDPQYVGENALLMPAWFAQDKAHVSPETVLQRQVTISAELTSKIFDTPELVTVEDFIADYGVSPDEVPVSESGLPEYMVFSAYDTSNTAEMRAGPCPEIYSKDGHLVTSDRQKLLAKLDELATLHRDVFENQAVQIGYYGGLEREKIEELINNPDFIPIAALDKETGDPLMFALFSPNFTELETIDWLNPGKVREMTQKYGQANAAALNLPLVVTSRFNGLGLFSSACQIGAHETIYRTQTNVTFLMYESNALSILYTPKVINKTLHRLGIPLLGAEVEATFITKKTT